MWCTVSDVLLILCLLQANTVYGALRGLEVMYDYGLSLKHWLSEYLCYLWLAGREYWQGCDCLDPYGSSLIDSHLSIIFQTFSQLCAFDFGTKSVQVYKAPWYIRDKPRFAYHGLLLGMLHLVFSQEK